MCILQGHPTIILAEICVQESQTVLRISVLRCQTATDFFTKTSAQRLTTREKYSLKFSKGTFFDIFAIFGTQKGRLAG